MFNGVANGITYLHNKQIVHRDLKLGNLLVMPNSNIVKICDFGFAAEENSASTVFCGSTSYLAPELIKKTLFVQKSVDIWSFGCCIYAMLMGTLPFCYDDGKLPQRQVFKRILFAIYRKPIKLLSIPGGSEAMQLFTNIFCHFNKRYTIEKVQLSTFFSVAQFAPVSFIY